MRFVRALPIVVAAGGVLGGCTADSAGTPPTCDTGLLDDGGTCVPAACGTGTWGNLALDEDTVYVKAASGDGEDSTGDGSQAAPFTSIQAGLDAAGDAGGGTVAVAAGTYTETLQMTADHADVHLAGRCADLVTVDASGGDEATPGLEIDAKAAEVEVSGVTVAGSNYVGVLVGSGSAVLRDSSVVDSEYIGVLAYQKDIQGTVLEMERCTLANNEVLGLLGYNPSTSVTLVETTVSDTRPDAYWEGGYGIQIYDGASLSATASTVTGSTWGGVLIFDPDTTVTFMDTAISDTQPDEDGGGGYGIDVYGGAALTAETCTITGNRRAGIRVSTRNTTADLRETTVSDIHPDEDDTFGVGIMIYEDAALTAESCSVTDITGSGINLYGDGTTATISETTISGTTDGISVGAGARLMAQACTVTNNTRLGVMVHGLRTQATLQETTLSDTLPDEHGAGGYGIQVSDGATLTANDCALSDNTVFGVLVGEGSHAIIEDTTIDSTVWQGAGNPDARDMTVSIGIVVQRGSTLEASNTDVSSTDGPALYVVDDETYATCTACSLLDNQFAGAVVVYGGSLELVDSIVEGTTENANIGGGYGVQAFPWDGNPPTLTLTDSTLRENPVSGIWLSEEGSYTLSGNEIHAGEGWTRSGQTRCGDAVYAQDVAAWDGSAGLLLVGNELLDGLGAGLFLQDASAVLDGNTYTDNAVDLVSQGSQCEMAPEGFDSEDLDPDRAELCPTYDYAICDNDAFRLYLELEDVESGTDKAGFPLLPGAALPAIPVPPAHGIP